MSGPDGDLILPVEAGAEDEDDGFGEAEYAAINSMLDQINSCLDQLEEKNDDLHARLQELLESSRQTRLEFQQQLGEPPAMPAPRLQEPPARPQPCPLGPGSGLGTHPLA
ncbi:bublin coiled-coil protein-like [Lemur catta]|uniref:bublin coiled-coil protein-like n=1 Tax=Lemur catta TaxID=9447 RepID=UPI001E26AEFC|nr:bublin coiled-coil protein-like [Lemur catta]